MRAFFLFVGSSALWEIPIREQQSEDQKSEIWEQFLLNKMNLNDDDAWSYSFPPSMESLPLKKSDDVNKATGIESEVAVVEQTDDSPVASDEKEVKEVGKVEEKEEKKEEDKDEDKNKDKQEYKEADKEEYKEEDKEEDKIEVDDEDIDDSENPIVMLDNDSSIDNENVAVGLEGSGKTSGYQLGLSPLLINTGNSNHNHINGNGNGHNNGYSHGSSSSISLTSPFVNKPLPPQTTKEDANSIISKESDDTKSISGGTPKKSYMSVARTALNSNLQAYDHIDEIEPITTSERVESSSPSDTKSPYSPSAVSVSGDGVLEQSPRIITYRKSRGRGESRGENELSNDSTASAAAVAALTKEKFDTKLYVEEKYKDTNYRYATIRRNTDFHQLFISLDLTDRLLEDFSCALSREILLQGRLYVSEMYVCFNSNLLGWVTNLVVKQEDIVLIEKKLTAGLFPNGIMIETKDGKQHTFASLISRDATFEFMRQVWQGCTGKVMADTSSINTVPGDKNRTWSSGSYALDRNGILQMDSGGKKLAEEESDDKFESYILSVDGDNPDEIEPDTDSDYSEDDDEEDDEDNEEEDEEEEEEEEAEEDEDWNGEEEGKLGSDKVVTSDKIEDLDILDTDVGAGGESGDSDSVNVVVVRFRPDSRYVNLGPETHPPTTVPYDYVNQDSEIPLCNETINAPLGIVMNILFGSENTDFHKSFLETHDASEISEYDKFSPAKDDPSNLERNYIYRRALGYSIGPKSTKCEVTETIESLNFNDHIVVLTSTVTPDVPLGNSFSVKTRYCLSWGPQNTTNLQMSYFIKWTGRSWIKSIIEKQSLSGQKSATEDLLVQLKEAIGLETIELKTKKKKKTKKSRKDNKSTPPTSIETKPASEVTGLISNTKVVAASPYSFNDLIRTNIVTVCYFIFSFLVMILILQLRLFKISNENNQLLRHQLLVTSHLVFNAQTGEPLEAKFKERIEKITLNSELWDWVEKQSPNGKKAKHLTLLDKVEFLTSQLQMLYKNEEEGDAPDIYESIESKFNDLKQQAQEFNYQELLNVGALKDAIGELL